MVEGHQCHRVGHAHRATLLGRQFCATAPNGRFADGAAALDGRVLSRIEVVGKNLFYFFSAPASAPGRAAAAARAAGAPADVADPAAAVLHFHFGMAGAFKTAPPPGPAPTPTTRLRLEAADGAVVGLLSAMVVRHGGVADVFEERRSALGEDPLRPDADPGRAWRKVRASKKPVGLLLMDQSVVAGVGNIYRAEVLYKAGVHPETPGCALGEAAWREVWRHCAELLRRGFVTGSILTVDPEEAAVLGEPWTRRYVYNQERCGRCLAPISVWDMAKRTVYACLGCQPLGAGVGIAPARAAALAAAKRSKKFVSHCAPDDDDGKQDMAPPVKPEEGGGREPPAAVPTPAGKAAPKRRRGAAAPAAPAVRPEAYAWAADGAGVATAAAAALEKAAAGEGRNVEHVALVDEGAAAVAAALAAAGGGAGGRARRARK